MPDYNQITHDKLKSLKDDMLQRQTTLRQYSLWLQTAEEEMAVDGPNGLHAAYARLEGLMQGLVGDEEIPGVDVIPGTGWQNLVSVVHQVQQETDIDFGLCRHLRNDGNPTTGYSCDMKKGLLIGSFKVCLPPLRTVCEHRPSGYWK